MDQSTPQGIVVKLRIFKDSPGTHPELFRIIGFLVVFAFSFFSSPNPPAFAQQRDYFQTTPRIQKFAVLLGGAASEEKYETQFRHWILKLYDILHMEYRYPADHIFTHLGKGDRSEPRITGPCRKESIRGTLRKLENQVQSGDQVLIVMVGHGTSDSVDRRGTIAKFNIVGPDFSGKDFSEWLTAFSRQDIIVVNTTNGSYPFSLALSAPGRVVISATRSSAEKYDTFFARFFIEALDNHSGDYDKNTRLSIWEAFQYARHRTQKWYEEQARLSTEHAVLDDNGDGLFNADPDPTQNDGSLAQVATIDLLSALLPERLAARLSSHELESAKKLVAKMLELERTVLLLRNRKSEMLKEEYWQQLEILLVDLARTTRQFRSFTAKKTGIDHPGLF